MGTVFYRAFLGAIAGLLAWVVCEPMFPKSELSSAKWGAVELLFITLLGLLIGGALGFAQGSAQGSRLRMAQWAGLGAFFGAIGAGLGYKLGSAMQSGLFPGVNFGNANSSSFIEQMIARMVVIAPLGLLIGLGIGACGFTQRRALVGALGGLIGGCVAGLLFDPISSMIAPVFLASQLGSGTVGADGIPRIQAEIGGPGRAVMAVVLGASIGLFTGIVDRISRTAWVRLVLGRNEGREWIVDAPQTFLGRSEKAHVPLFGDDNVAPMHAMIQKSGGGYTLIDGGSPLGTGLNGMRVAQAPLMDGAQIQIGTHTLVFQLRAGAAVRAAEAARGAPTALAQGGMPPNQPNYPNNPNTSFPDPLAPSQNLAPTIATTSVAMMSPTLIATEGPLAGQRFPVVGTIEMGREGGAAPLGFDSSVSRRHAQFAMNPQGAVVVTDLGSTNGTFVNGQRVQTTTLKAGDFVKIGITTFRVE